MIIATMYMMELHGSMKNTVGKGPSCNFQWQNSYSVTRERSREGGREGGMQEKKKARELERDTESSDVRKKRERQRERVKERDEEAAVQLSGLVQATLIVG